MASAIKPDKREPMLLGTLDEERRTQPEPRAEGSQAGPALQMKHDAIVGQPRVAGTGTRRSVHAVRAAVDATLRFVATRWGRRVAIAVVSLVVVVPILLGFVYPRVGEWAIRTRLLPKLERRIGMQIQIDNIDVGLGHATLRGLHLINKRGVDCGTIDNVDIDFATLRSLVGSISVNSVDIEKIRLQLNQDQLLGSSEGPTRVPGSSSGFRTMLPAIASARDVAITVEGKGSVSFASATFDRDTSTAELNDVQGAWITPVGSATFAATSATVTGRRFVEVVGGLVRTAHGELNNVHASLLRQQQFIFATAVGGYNSSSGAMWTLRATTNDGGTTARAEIMSVAGNKTPASLAVVEVSERQITVDGAVSIGGWTLQHPAFSEQPIANINTRIELKGRYDRATKKFELPMATIHKDGVDVAIAGTLEQLPHRSIDIRVTIPPVACQTALLALPPELVPHLAGYMLDGTFALDIRGAIDSMHLAKSSLESTGGLAGCSVVSAPENSPSKLVSPFVHHVEVAPHQYEEWIVGNKNPWFVSLDALPEYVVSSLVATEDPTFRQREKFAAPGLARALIENLRSGSFRIGGSTIPMQLAKNLFLNGKRTLSRKLEELFLAWHIESSLSRYRILEIYFNVIEFGPGIYGVGRAVRELFGKPMYELMPADAAYFSSIVPKPRTSYRNFCNGAIDADTKTRMQRALTLMVNQGEISSEDWEVGATTQFEFAKRKGTLEQCMERRHQALTLFDNR
jgi:hypothetical protein